MTFGSEAPRPQAGLRLALLNRVPSGKFNRARRDVDWAKGGVFQRRVCGDKVYRRFHAGQAGKMA